MTSVVGLRQKRNYSSIWILVLLCHEVISSNPNVFDFIIVGGGTAGCLLASRLSEMSEWSVLLVEAGGEENTLHDIPLIAPMFILSPSNWGFKAEKSSAFGLGLRGSQMIWPRGKVLGGSSTINGQVYTRGNRKDYDDWEEMGNVGWGYERVLPYFLKSEKMEIPELANDTKYHSTKGDLNINYPPYRTEIAKAFVSAGMEEGYNLTDVNGECQVGFTYSQTTMKDGHRVSSYRAFLEHARTRKNLHVWTNRMVTKVLINPQTREAYGVEFLFGLIPIQALARKEVILSAGTINSPKLLMLSGVGPKEHLEDVGIEVLQASRVGHNLQDHVSTLSLFFTINNTNDIRMDKPISVTRQIGKYVAINDGEFTVPSGFEGISFLDVGDNDNFPEIEMFFGGILLPTIPFYLSKLGVLSDEFNEFYKPIKSKHGFTVLPMLLRPYSGGFLKLRDNDPSSTPLIYPNFFSDPRDMDTLIKGINMIIDLLKTKALQSLGADIYRDPLPPCKSHQFGSDEYWECCIRYLTLSIQHAVGTCKMGPDSDPDAVLDSSLRVRGITKLRVADASIMPFIPTGHTMAPVYMIAEKAADMIKADWL